MLVFNAYVESSPPTYIYVIKEILLFPKFVGDTVGNKYMYMTNVTTKRDDDMDEMMTNLCVLHYTNSQLSTHLVQC